MTLIEGEEVIKRMRPHWVFMLPVVILFIIFTTVYVFLYSVIMQYTIGVFKDVFFWVITIVYASVVLFSTLKRTIWWLTTKYLFTSERIVTRTGLLLVKGESIALNKVQSIQFEKTLLERIFGSGNLIIDSASENDININFVTDAEGIQQQIYAQISSNERNTDNSI